MTRYTLRQIKDGTGFPTGQEFETVERYNGWTNYETWAVALWINNDQGWQESVHEDVRTAADEYREDECGACEDGETHPLPAWQAGRVIRENVERVVCLDFGREDDTMPASLSSDLVTASLGRVNWTELGATFLEDFDLVPDA